MYKILKPKKFKFSNKDNDEDINKQTKYNLETNLKTFSPFRQLNSIYDSQTLISNKNSIYFDLIIYS